MNGPVPALNGFSVKSAPMASTTFWLTIMPARSTSAPRSGENADFRLNFTVFASTTWAVAHSYTLPKQAKPDDAKRAATWQMIKWFQDHSVTWTVTGGVLGALLVREWFAARRLAFVHAADGRIRPLPGPSFRHPSPT